MRVHLSTHFVSYTGGRSVVEAEGPTLAAAFLDLDRRFPGLRFRLIDEQERVRRHVKVFVNARTAESLATPLSASDELHILGALSGG